MPGQIWIPAADNNVNEALAGGCPLAPLLAFHQSGINVDCSSSWNGIGIEWDMGHSQP